MSLEHSPFDIAYSHADLAQLHAAVRAVDFDPQAVMRARTDYASSLALVNHYHGAEMYDAALKSAVEGIDGLNEQAVGYADQFVEMATPPIDPYATVLDNAWLYAHRRNVSADLRALSVIVNVLGGRDLQGEALPSPGALLRAYLREAVMGAAALYPEARAMVTKQRYPLPAFVGSTAAACLVARYPSLQAPWIRGVLQKHRHDLAAVPEVLDQKVRAQYKNHAGGADEGTVDDQQ